MRVGQCLIPRHAPIDEKVPINNGTVDGCARRRLLPLLIYLMPQACLEIEDVHVAQRLHDQTPVVELYLHCSQPQP